jgi:preprotein translocase subunit SecA
MIRSVIAKAVDSHCPDNDVPEDWDFDSLITYAHTHFLPEDRLTKDDLWGKEKEEMIEMLVESVNKLYDEREETIGLETMREFEKVVVLRAVDSKWMDHIDSMDHLRQGIHLRAYGGNDPLREYQFEGHNMFLSMIERIEEEVTLYIMKAQVQAAPKREAVAEGQAVDAKAEEGPKKPKTRTAGAVGRNDPCPCGSGKKYKMCHGRID